MILIFVLSLLNLAQADPSWKWSNSVELSEKHEFYKDNQLITHPQDTWQTLFAVVYKDANLKTFKDCIFFKVPGEELGILKIKTILNNEKCDTYLYKAGDQERTNLKALQYSIQSNSLRLSLTNQKFEVEKWETPLFNLFEIPDPKPLMSSAEYRSSKMIYLQPYKGVLKVKPHKSKNLMNSGVCHEIASDCQEKAPSTCSQCEKGWYEIPNGCAQSSKFCGVNACGLKHRPACPRGKKYQAVPVESECRMDKSFAYCSEGLSVECRGNLAYCL